MTCLMTVFVSLRSVLGKIKINSRITVKEETPKKSQGTVLTTITTTIIRFRSSKLVSMMIATLLRMTRRCLKKLRQ